jgi:dihydroneopterin aldolase
VKVYIEDLTFKAIIGLLPFERVKKQTVIVNASFEYRYNDKEKDFVDYSKVAEEIKKSIKKEKFELIEEALETLHKKLYKKFPLKNLQIKITKPDILKECRVSVEY